MRMAMMLCISSQEPGCVTFAAVSVPGAVKHGLAAMAYPTEDRLAVMLSGAGPCLLVPASGAPHGLPHVGTTATMINPNLLQQNLLIELSCV